MKNSFLSLLLLLLVFPQLGTSQDSLTNELRFEVHKILPPISITKEQLTAAKTIADLNKYYKSSWIREYISIEVLSSNKGKHRKALSKNDTLSQEQKDNMITADVGSEMSVRVQYIPENTLQHNDVKEIDFAFTIDPESDAGFPGGDQALRKYLKENAIVKIPEGSFKGYDLTVVKFTINEEGEIIEAHLFGKEYPTSIDEKINELLVEVVRKMPCWKPAEYADGTKVEQDFAFIVGNMKNCMIYQLNIPRQLK